MNTRVQIPAYTDHWMRGDRFGEIIRTFRRRHPLYPQARIEVAVVRLDKSGKTAKVVLDDCTVL